VCDLETSTMRRRRADWSCCTKKNENWELKQLGVLIDAKNIFSCNMYGEVIKAKLIMLWLTNSKSRRHLSDLSIGGKIIVREIYIYMYYKVVHSSE
jgi:hypothetical protein